MKTWKKLSISFSCFLAFFFGEILVNIACGPERDPYDYYISYFHQNLADDKLPSNFFVSALRELFSTDDVDQEADINVAEWSGYLKGKVSSNAIYSAMYQTDSAANVKLIAYNGKNLNDLPDSLCRNEMVVKLAHPDLNAALRYFSFAKRCEEHVTAAANYWNPKPRDSIKMVQLAGEAIKMAVANKDDDFLRLRYAFQGLRLYKYADDAQSAIKTYEQYILNDKQLSAVKGWSMSLYAGALRTVGQTGKAAFLFARVFQTNPERRIQAYRSFSFTNPDVDSALRFAETKADKANIYAIRAFDNREFDLEDLKGVYRNDPANTLNGFLLTREINKLELALIEDKDIAQTAYYFYNEPDSAKDSVVREATHHLIKLRQFALQLDAGKQYPQYGFGKVAAAYLSWLQFKDDLASQYLSSINPAQLKGKVADQYRIVQLLLNVRKLRKGSLPNETQLLAALKWLDEKRFKETGNIENPGYFYRGEFYANKHFNVTAHSFYQQELAPAYLKMGDTARAAMAMLKADLNSKKLQPVDGLSNIMAIQTLTLWRDHLSPATLRKIINYSIKPVKGTLTGFLAEGVNTLKKDDLYDLYGTTCLRVNDYKNAVAAFNKIGAAYKYFVPSDYVWLDSTSVENELYSDPFEPLIKDYPKKYSANPTGITKKTFAVEMLRLSNLVKNDARNAAKYYYKMANGIYQTGLFGNSWSLVRYSWSTVEAPKLYDDNSFLRAATAKRLYIKARSLTNDKELQAKITFMLAKCVQKSIVYRQDKDSYNGSYYFNNFKSDDYFRISLKNPYFAELKNNYSKTAFFKVAAHECSYFREFVQPGSVPVKKKSD